MTMLSLTVSILNFLPGGGCTSSGGCTAGTVVLVANLQYKGKNNFYSAKVQKKTAQ
jgi:hypothetical protein